MSYRRQILDMSKPNASGSSSSSLHNPYHSQSVKPSRIHSTLQFSRTQSEKSLFKPHNDVASTAQRPTQTQRFIQTNKENAVTAAYTGGQSMSPAKSITSPLPPTHSHSSSYAADASGAPLNTLTQLMAHYRSLSTPHQTLRPHTAPSPSHSPSLSITSILSPTTARVSGTPLHTRLPSNPTNNIVPTISPTTSSVSSIAALLASPLLQHHVRIPSTTSSITSPIASPRKPLYEAEEKESPPLSASLSHSPSHMSAPIIPTTPPMTTRPQLLKLAQTPPMSTFSRPLPSPSLSTFQTAPETMTPISSTKPVLIQPALYATARPIMTSPKAITSILKQWPATPPQLPSPSTPATTALVTTPPPVVSVKKVVTLPLMEVSESYGIPSSDVVRSQSRLSRCGTNDRLSFSPTAHTITLRPTTAGSWFALLSQDITTEILARTDYITLLLTATRVCRDWHKLIQQHSAIWQYLQTNIICQQTSLEDTTIKYILNDTRILRSISDMTIPFISHLSFERNKYDTPLTVPLTDWASIISQQSRYNICINTLSLSLFTHHSHFSSAINYLNKSQRRKEGDAIIQLLAAFFDKKSNNKTKRRSLTSPLSSSSSSGKRRISTDMTEMTLDSSTTHLRSLSLSHIFHQVRPSMMGYGGDHSHRSTPAHVRTLSYSHSFLSSLATYCTSYQLKQLILYENTCTIPITLLSLMSDTSLQLNNTLSSSSSSLSSLQSFVCNALTDDHMLSLCSITSLTHLDLRGNALSLTNNSLIHLRLLNHSLKCLQIDVCSNNTIRTISDLLLTNLISFTYILSSSIK